MHFVTDHSARGVLRGLVRDVAQSVPSEQQLKSKIILLARSARSLEKAVSRVQEFLAPYAFSTEVTRMPEAFLLRAHTFQFEEDDTGWSLKVNELMATLDPQQPRISTYFDTKIRFTGHALSRLFQRAAVIARPDVFRELKIGVLFIGYWRDAIAQGARPRQIVCPTNAGVFLGEVTYHTTGDTSYTEVVIKTFIGDGKEKYDRVKVRLSQLYVTIYQNSQIKQKTRFTTLMESYRMKMIGIIGEAVKSHVIADNTWVLEPYVPPEE